MRLVSLAILILTRVVVRGIVSFGNEELLTLAELAKRLPRRRQNRPVHPSTVHRWRRPGIAGVRLECLRVGGVWCTSLAAVQRFCERLSRADPRPSPGQAASDPHAAAPNSSYQDSIERKLIEGGA
jgi:hypothetical protein